jgi:hypothetical protein
MRKRAYLWISALLLLAAGTSGCSSSDDEEYPTPVDTSDVKINELVILSKNNTVTEIAQTRLPYYDNPRCYISCSPDPYHRDDPTLICYYKFSCIIGGSTITSLLDMQIQRPYDQDFENLKVGDTFECTVEETSDKTHFSADASIANTDGTKGLNMVSAKSGRITVVDDKPVDGKPTITLKIENLTFPTCTINGTMQFDTYDFIEESINVMGDRYAVCGGEAYEGWGIEGGSSDPLAVFFREELHGPYWDGDGNEYKTFFEQGKWDDESCLVFNSREEFQNAYMGTKELPDVDFDKYTLVIGRTWGNDSSYDLNIVFLKNKGDYYELETTINHYVDRVASFAIVKIYYWYLFNKFEKKDVVIKRIVKDVK